MRFGISKFHLQPPKSNQALQYLLKSNKTIQVISLFKELLRKNPSSIDSFSFLFVLKACTQKSASFEGKQLHCSLLKSGFLSIIQLQTSLLQMYSATRNLTDAHHMFDQMPLKNIVSWTALISAYVDNHKPSEAIELFRQIQVGNVEPDQVTMTVLISACAHLGALEMGERIHAYICSKQALNVDLSLRNALINMYAKCGDIQTARQVFDKTNIKDVTTWTSMIVGHALHGQPKEALKLFEEMKETNKSSRKKKKQKRVMNVDGGSCFVVPNAVTYIGVLMACSHAGMVEEGKHHFTSMREDYGLEPNDSHYGCMVDLFCRAGLLVEAQDFILKMPTKPNAVVWRTLLGACSRNANIELGSEVRRRLHELEPCHVGDYIAMSNILAAKGMWDEKLIVRNQIKERRVPGCSSIEVESRISEFVSGVNDHPLVADIHEVLEHLLVNMIAYGYSPKL